MGGGIGKGCGISPCTSQVAIKSTGSKQFPPVYSKNILRQLFSSLAVPDWRSLESGWLR